MNTKAETVDLYVYYRVSACAAADVHATRDRIRAMQAELERWTGVKGGLARRRDDPRTWMEVYPSVSNAPALEHQLEAACKRFEIDTLIEPGTARHIERFVPCA